MVIALSLVTAACGDGEEAPPPTTAPVETTVPPTSRPPFTVTTTPGRPRTTTTQPTDISVGAARISGSVVGPQGLVAGASVKVERLVGDDVATANLTAHDGRFNLPSIRGGTYRVRAWKAPDLALSEPEVFFLAADENKTLELRLTRFGDLNVRVEVDPARLPAEEPFTVTVQVYAGSVNNDGVVQGVSRPGLVVQVAVSAGLALQGPDRATTDAAGRASFRIRCTAAGPVGGDAIVESTRTPLGLPNCPGT